MWQLFFTCSIDWRRFCDFVSFCWLPIFFLSHVQWTNSCFLCLIPHSFSRLKLRFHLFINTWTIAGPKAYNGFDGRSDTDIKFISQVLRLHDEMYLLVLSVIVFLSNLSNHVRRRWFSWNYFTDLCSKRFLRFKMFPNNAFLVFKSRVETCDASTVFIS